MPMVGGKEFPYTKKGMEAAKKARNEDSMGRSAARNYSVKKGATPGEANRAQSVTPGEVRENQERSLRAVGKKMEADASKYKAPFYGDGGPGASRSNLPVAKGAAAKKQALRNYGKKK